MRIRRKFQMPFEPATIEHLGLRLYSTLPPVIAELVSNAYDAESPKVDVQLPTGPITSEAEVVVRDWGHGMGPDELQNEYLPIGRNRRGKASTDPMSKNGKVRVTGRKGLGKLSAFGVAEEMDIRAVKGGQAICLRLNFDDIKAWPEDHGRAPYEPKVVDERTGSTGDADGVEIRLRKLKRSRAISPGVVRRGLVKRLRFIGPGFLVLVNGQGPMPGDRMKRENCQEGFSWSVDDLPGEVSIGEDLVLNGWIGFLSTSSHVARGVDIFAAKKAVELGSFFSYGSPHAQYPRAYLVGEIHADFLDENEDLIATARNAVIWESDVGQALKDWGQSVLKWAFNRWVELRKQAKEHRIITAAGYDLWLKTRQPTEQRVAEKMVKILVDDPNIEPESARPLLEIIKSSVETVAFRELVARIEDEGAHAATLLQLFDEWRVIEAREHLKVAGGRRAAIAKLEHFMNTGALEVKQVRPLFEKNPWLIDPAWTEANVEKQYTTLLRKHCTEPKSTPEEDRRIDILGVTAGGTLRVVELKRPQKTLSRKDMNQVGAYVDWARARFGKGTGPDAAKYVSGLLIVGKMSGLAEVIEGLKRLEGDDIRVETFADLHRRSREYYSQIDSVLKKIAPEYLAARKRGKVSGN